MTTDNDFQLTWDKSGYIAGEPMRVSINFELPPPPIFPNETNTGPTGSLTSTTTAGGTISGDGTYITFGAGPIENWDITTNRQLYFPADNTVVRNCRITYTGKFGAKFSVMRFEGANAVFQDSELDCQDLCERGISGPSSSGKGMTVTRCNIHNTPNGIEKPGPITVEDSYIHEIYTPVGQTSHADGIQISNPNGSTIRHCTVFNPSTETSCLGMNDGAGTWSSANILVENCLIGGGGYSMNVFGASVVIQNNRFSTRYWPKVGQFGAWYPVDYASHPGTVRRGNVIHETGQPCDV